jgi:hypothetical protein
MGQTKDLGTRIELLSMDPHFHDISIALYRQAGPGGPIYTINTYSQRPGASDRIAWLLRAMVVLGGLEPVASGSEWFRFPCGAAHQNSVRRIFLESAKQAPSGEPAPRPLSTLDKKNDLPIRVISEGGGVYRVEAGRTDEDARKRAVSVATGLAKLAEMARPDGPDSERVAFECRHSHDAAIGLLLPRALNVRVAMREEEMANSRGVLLAPSSQR